MVWSEFAAVPDEHPFRAELDRARKSADVAPLLAAIAARYGVTSVALGVGAYVTASLRGGFAIGGFGLLGIQSALERVTQASDVFGRFEGALPALDLGMHNGCTLFASLASGNIVSLHHDASLYEVAGRVTARTLPAAMASLEARGSAVDITQLLALQAELAATFPSERMSGPLYARVVLDVLGLKPAEARRRFETLPFEFLGLRAEDCDELPKPGVRVLPSRESAPRTTRGGKLRPTHPRVARHLAERGSSATELDLSYARLERLPPEVLALESLERLDLSGNPKLDLGEAFDQLAALPRLAEVRFRGCHDGPLPPSFARLQATTTLDIGRLFAASLEVAAALPHLQDLRAGLPYKRDTQAAELLASSAFDRLTSLTVNCRSTGPLGALLARKRSLEAVSLIDVESEAIDPVSMLPALDELTLRRAYTVPRLKGGARRLVLDRCAIQPAALRGLARLEALTLDPASGSNVLPDIHPGAPLTELAVESYEADDWGPLRARLGALTSLRVQGWDGKPSLLPPLGASDCPALRTLDAGMGGLRGGAWRFDPVVPFAAIECLRADAQPLPEWLRDTGLRRVAVPACDAERSLALALDLQNLEWIEGSCWDAPLSVPSAHVFAQCKRLRRFELDGAYADPATAMASISEAPNLQHLTWFFQPLTSLPTALGDRPLRSFHYFRRAKEGPGLDLASAFEVLGKTPLAELTLSGVNAVPPEIARLQGLEELVVYGPIAPRLPEAALASLPRLRSLRLTSAKLVGPARKKLEAALPACAIHTST